jgi:hypothetical protein
VDDKSREKGRRALVIVHVNYAKCGAANGLAVINTRALDLNGTRDYMNEQQDPLRLELSQTWATPPNLNHYPHINIPSGIPLILESQEGEEFLTRRCPTRPQICVGTSVYTTNRKASQHDTPDFASPMHIDPLELSAGSTATPDG